MSDQKEARRTTKTPRHKAAQSQPKKQFHREDAKERRKTKAIQITNEHQ